MKELCDNASIEFFFHSMKADTIHARTFDDDYLRGTLAHPSTTKTFPHKERPVAGNNA